MTADRTEIAFTTDTKGRMVIYMPNDPESVRLYVHQSTSSGDWWQSSIVKKKEEKHPRSFGYGQTIAQVIESSKERLLQKQKERDYKARQLAAQVKSRAERAERAAKKANVRTEKIANAEIGECQICAGEFKLVPNPSIGARATATHGYKRPGDGMIHGRCLGANELPYEVSSSLLAAFVVTLRKDLADAKASLARVDEQNQITEMSGSFRNPTFKTYKRGEIGFESALENDRWSRKRRVSGLEREIEQQQRRLDAWSPKR